MTFEDFSKNYKHYCYNGIECIWSQPKWSYYNLFAKFPLEHADILSKESVETAIKHFFHIDDAEQVV